MLQSREACFEAFPPFVVRAQLRGGQLLASVVIYRTRSACLVMRHGCDWFSTMHGPTGQCLLRRLRKASDALDDEVIDRLAAGQIDKETA